MKKITTCLLIAVLFSACGTIQYVPVETIKEVHVKDTTVLHDTTIQYQIEKEYVRDYTGLLDELVLETEYAIAKAHVDTAAEKLTGSIENKDKALNIPTQYKERLVYRDTVITKEVSVPVEVEKKVPFVPFFWKFLSVIGILAIAYITFKLLFKFKF